jgi:hypothetical protein
MATTPGGKLFVSSSPSWRLRKGSARPNAARKLASASCQCPVRAIVQTSVMHDDASIMTPCSVMSAKACKPRPLLNGLRTAGMAAQDLNQQMFVSMSLNAHLLLALHT